MTVSAYTADLDHSAWNDWLEAVGIAHDDDNIQRVIVDLNVADVVRIYVQRRGHPTVLRIAPPKVEIHDAMQDETA